MIKINNFLTYHIDGELFCNVSIDNDFVHIARCKHTGTTPIDILPVTSTTFHIVIVM